MQRGRKIVGNAGKRRDRLIEMHIAAINGGVVRDPRVRLHALELGLFLKSVRLGAVAAPDPGHDGWLALILDLDEGPVRDEWARMEVEAYLKVWRALHPDCSVELVA